MASTESIKHLEADEPLAKSRANSGAYAPEKEPRFPLAFLGVQGGGLLPLAMLFNLPEEARQKAGYLSRSIEAKNWE